MNKIFVFLFLFSFVFVYGFIYEFQAKNAFGKNLDFSKFEDSTLIIFTSDKDYHSNSRLHKINKLHHKYKQDDIHFVGFAINDTNKTNDDFSVLNYGVDFNMVGVMNNDISLLKSYIDHLYKGSYGYLLSYDRQIKIFADFNALKKYLKTKNK